ncbi:MAG: hypothetical protein M3Z66_06530 [Chloroflexota bacterium]|nr:hypothetical protein [Chloroflexota bacterium]
MVRVRWYFIIIPSLGPNEIGVVLGRKTSNARAYSERFATGGIEQLRITKQALLVRAELQGPSRIRRGIPNATWIVVRGRIPIDVDAPGDVPQND